jgi:hypothetical protein
MPKWRRGNVRDDAGATMMPAPQRQQWQRRHDKVRNDTSVAMAMMPKRRWQWRQHDYQDEVSAETATMARAQKQRLQ